MTDRLFEEFDPFDLVGTVPRDLLATDREIQPEGTYLRVADDSMKDGAITDLVDEAGPVGVAAWFALLVTAKQARNYGVVDMHARSFGQMFGATADEVLRALAAIERAGLAWVRHDPAHPKRVMVRVRRWERWQSMTDAERARLMRARKADDRHGKAVGVTETRVAVTDNRSTSRHEDEDLDEDVGSFVPTFAPVPASAPTPAREAPPISDEWQAQWKPAVDALDCITKNGDEGVRAWLYDQIALHHRRYGHPPDAYARAAVACAAKVAKGDWPDNGQPIPWYLGMVRYHVHQIDKPPTGDPHATPRRPLRKAGKFGAFD